MKAFLVILGVAVITISIVGGALYLSGNYEQYQRRLQALGAQPGTPITLFDMAKWEFALLVGGAMLFGGSILGSILIGLGWIGGTLEEIREVLAMEESVSSTPPMSHEPS